MVKQRDSVEIAPRITHAGCDDVPRSILAQLGHYQKSQATTSVEFGRGNVLVNRQFVKVAPQTGVKQEHPHNTNAIWKR